MPNVLEWVAAILWAAAVVGVILPARRAADAPRGGDGPSLLAGRVPGPAAWRQGRGWTGGLR